MQLFLRIIFVGSNLKKKVKERIPCGQDKHLVMWFQKNITSPL